MGRGVEKERGRHQEKRRWFVSEPGYRGPDLIAVPEMEWKNDLAQWVLLGCNSVAQDSEYLECYVIQFYSTKFTHFAVEMLSPSTLKDIRHVITSRFRYTNVFT